MSSISIQEGPTLTTKALLVSIVAPRKFVKQKPPTHIETTVQETNDGAIPTTDNLKPTEEKDTIKKDKSKPLQDLFEPPPPSSENIQKTNEAEAIPTTTNEAAAAAVDLPDIVQTNYTDTIKRSNKTSIMDQGTNTEACNSEKPMELPPVIMDQPEFEEAENPTGNLIDKENNEEEKNIGSDRTPTADMLNEDENTIGDIIVDQDITEEEKAAVVVGGHQEKAEINVEELLRIAFTSLLEEWHLLNAPTYSYWKDKQVQQQPYVPGGSVVSLESQAATHEGSPKDPKLWVHVQVMARPASLGVILERLERIGVGTMCGTVSFYKAELCRTASSYAHLPVAINAADDMDNRSVGTQKSGLSQDKMDDGESQGSPDKEARDMEQERLQEEERLKADRVIADARNEWKNAATRLRIEQVREQIAEGAVLSFDFISLLTVASILAGIGLITDNTVVIVASMLVSPIMGPVLGLTFGSRVKDWKLVQMSLLNESLALLGCVVIGGFVGVCSSFISLADEFPTNEMLIRGEARGLITGVAVAIPSGMGVCLSILGGNTSSLVGVAISASLLPPAVNSGICFAYALFLSLDSVQSANEEYLEEDYIRIGYISFALTVVNIVCIWLSGIVMFEIKEVAPMKQKSAFWASDIKAARNLNQQNQKPVNYSLLRNGLKSAMNRRLKKSNKKLVEKVRIRVHPEPKYPTYFGSVGMALPLTPQRRWPYQLSAALADDIQDTEHGIEDESNIRYVGLEDMAALLGFDEEDDEDIIPTPKEDQFPFLF